MGCRPDSGPRAEHSALWRRDAIGGRLLQALIKNSSTFRIVYFYAYTIASVPVTQHARRKRPKFDIARVDVTRPYHVKLSHSSGRYCSHRHALHYLCIFGNCRRWTDSGSTVSSNGISCRGTVLQTWSAKQRIFLHRRSRILLKGSDEARCVRSSIRL